MHSMSLKVSTDFYGSTWRNLPGRGSSGLADLDTGIRRVRMNFGYCTRNCRIVACSSERNSNGGGPSRSSSSFLSRSQTHALLKQQMEVAAKSEDYKEAARIRDSLRSFVEEEPVLRLRRLLKKAIFDERFQDASRYRDELKEIAPHSLLKSSSDATTLACFYPRHDAAESLLAHKRQSRESS